MDRVFTKIKFTFISIYKPLLFLLGFVLIGQILSAQCNNGSSYTSVAAPAAGAVTIIATDQWQTEYGTITGVVAGATYISSYNNTTGARPYITVRSGSSGGAVVAFGFAPLEWTAAVAGNHYVHYNTNAACGTATSGRISTIGRSIITTTCSSTFTDLNGGSNYGNNQTMIWKFFPATAGEKVRVAFTAFATENNFDGMMIYDGNSTAATLISSGLGVGTNPTTCPAGSWRGAGSPGTITSTAPDGSLTFVFTSDDGTTAAGWSANVTCYNPCTTVPGTSSSSITNSCGSTNTTLSLAGEGAGTIQWQQSTDGGTTWTNIAGATTDPSGYTATVTTMFRAAVTNGCTSYSTTSSITMNCIITHPSSGTTSTTIQCGAGTYTYYDPGGTGNYGNNQLGTLTINPSSVGQMVQINFGAGAFSIEPNGGGCYDWIQIYDGPNTGSPLLGTYCSSNVPGVITSTTGPLTIVFDSDGLTTASGWVANVTCFTPCSTVAGTSSSSVTNSCGSTSTTLSLAGEGAGSIQWQQSTDGGTTWTNIAGATTDPYVHTTSVTKMFRAAVNNGCTSYSTTSSITMNCIITHPSSGTTSTTIQCGAGTYTYYDPGGTGNYGNNQLGTLTINPSSVGQMVQINFGAGAFSIEPNGGGCYDWIQIYDGPNTGSPLLGTYCSSNVPGVITSTTGPLTIVFDSDGLTTASGWVANVACFSPCAVVAGTSSSSITQACAATNTTLSLAGEGAGTIQWQQSTDGGVTWVNIAGATTDPYVFAATVNAMFRAGVTSGCTSYSTTSSITFSCDIIHPASGFASTTIQCGNSYTYKDPGNTGNYGNNQNGLITICPSTAGQYVNVNFTAFNTESGFDYFYVFDGGNASAPILGIYSGNGGLSGNVKATASNTSGCLSFRFYSDGGTTASGWQGTVTCSGTPSATVPSSNPEDCQGAYTICNNGTFTGGTNNYGFNELPDQWNSCLGIPPDRGEYESTWAVFSPATSGTIGFSITPTSACDYDWAIWGPYNSLQCPAFTNDVPVRCSSSSLASTGNPGTTGLIAPATDVIEQNGEYGGGSNENGKLKPLDVLAGEIYVMMLDNWSSNTTPFALNWNLTNGATLDCAPVLPVTMSSFNNSCKNGNTLLEWSTASETNNDYFAIERSDQDFKFYEIGRVMGSGNSNINNSYSFLDPAFNDKTTYYRIKQVDFNGEFRYHRIVASSCYKTEFEVVNHQLTSDKLDLTVNSFENESVIIYLYDLRGRLIIEANHQLTQGNNKISLNNINIESGIYLINIVGEVHHYQTKLIRK